MVSVELPPPAIEFTVYGVAATKGNKSGFAVRKGGVLTGKVAMREGKSKSFPEWNRRVTEVVQSLARSGAPMLDGPIVAWVAFFLPKPASAPKRRRMWPDRKPDLSKLLRAIEDPCNGVLIADDARIVRFDRLEKAYAEDSGDPRPRAEVKLWRLQDLYPQRYEQEVIQTT